VRAEPRAKATPAPKPAPERAARAPEADDAADSPRASAPPAAASKKPKRELPPYLRVVK
jgi:hypothetical protein